MQSFLSILKGIGIFIGGLILLLILFVVLDNDARTIQMGEAEKASIVATKKYSTSSLDATRFKVLMEEYGQNKTLPKGYEYQALLALSHYPELKDTPIDFLFEPVFLPLASRPSPVTVLLPWLERRYWVVISNKSKPFFEAILFHRLPFNEQVGVLGHELAHSVFYQDKHAYELAQIAYRYQHDNEYRISFERATDERAIAHGLGYQLYDYAFFVRKAFGDTPQEIAAEEGGMYLSPKEIKQGMKVYPFYKDTLNPLHYYFPETY